MPISCPQCHARIPEDVSFCPGCGLRMWLPGQDTPKHAQETPRAATPPVDVWTLQPAIGATAHLKDRLMAALAYVTFVPAVLLVLIPASRRNRFIRFHAFQSILFTIATIFVAIAMWILFSVLQLIPAIGFPMAWLALAVMALGLAIVWLVLLVKALQGQSFRLPAIGNLAAKA